MFPSSGSGSEAESGFKTYLVNEGRDSVSRLFSDLAVYTTCFQGLHHMPKNPFY